MVSELKTFRFNCDICGRSATVVEIYEKLPEGWKAIPKVDSINKNWHYCAGCQGQTVKENLATGGAHG